MPLAADAPAYVLPCACCDGTCNRTYHFCAAFTGTINYTDATGILSASFARQHDTEWTPALGVTEFFSNQGPSGPTPETVHVFSSTSALKIGYHGYVICSNIDAPPGPRVYLSITLAHVDPSFFDQPYSIHNAGFEFLFDTEADIYGTHTLTLLSTFPFADAGLYSSTIDFVLSAWPC